MFTVRLIGADGSLVREAHLDSLTQLVLARSPGGFIRSV